MTDDPLLSWLNALSQNDAPKAFEACCGSRTWCCAMAARLPLFDRSSIHQVADESFRLMSHHDWLEAFAHHPKIGDIQSLRMKFAGNRQWSASEQSSVQGVDESTLLALAEENAKYERRFGFIFIVCATGRSADEMLCLLRSRMRNEVADEVSIAAEEQRKITHLRIDKWQPPAL